MERGALQQCASCHGDAANEDGPTAAKRIADEDGEDGTHKTSQIVSSNRNALVCAALRNQCDIPFDSRVLGIDTGEVFVERWQVQQTTCYTLIITEKPVIRDSQRSVNFARQQKSSSSSSNVHEIETAQEGNGQVERPASPAIVFWNPKHDGGRNDETTIGSWTIRDLSMMGRDGRPASSSWRRAGWGTQYYIQQFDSFDILEGGLPFPHFLGIDKWGNPST